MAPSRDLGNPAINQMDGSCSILFELKLSNVGEDLNLQIKAKNKKVFHTNSYCVLAK